MFYPSKKIEFNTNNNTKSNFLSDASLVLVRCNFWSNVGHKFADLVSKGIVNDEGCDSSFDINKKSSFEGIQIHFILLHRTEGYCKILYTKKVNTKNK